jgi:hypothetical protein
MVADFTLMPNTPEWNDGPLNDLLIRKVALNLLSGSTLPNREAEGTILLLEKWRVLKFSRGLYEVGHSIDLFL